MSYTPTVVRSRQQGSIVTVTNSTTRTATITAVDTGKSSLTYLGFNNGSPDDTGIQCRLTLTNSTTVTATKTQNAASGSAPTVNFEVLEFY